MNNSSSSEDFSSNTKHETSSATTPTYTVSPGVSSLDEGIKNTIYGGGGAEDSITALLDLKEQRDGSWLNVDYFFNSHIGLRMVQPRVNTKR